MVNRIRISKSNNVLLPKNKNKDKELIDKELAGCKFPDERLGKRLKNLFSQMSSCIGKPIPFACQDWANTRAIK
jgi:sulfite reductase beta subunit-like hemoprotein